MKKSGERNAFPTFFVHPDYFVPRSDAKRTKNKVLKGRKRSFFVRQSKKNISFF
jgi:hypothetical protein